MRPNTLLCLFCLSATGASTASTVPAAPRPPAPLTAIPYPDFLRLAESEIAQVANHDFVEEREHYWRKCALALKSRRDSRSHALRGVGLFLATVPLEYAISRHRHIRHAEPVTLNAAAFVMMGATLFQLSRSYLRWEHYERDRNCCRLWQEYAKPTTGKLAAADAPFKESPAHAQGLFIGLSRVGPSRPFSQAQVSEGGY